MQFSTTEEHVQLVERAKALFGHSAPGKSLGELHLKAMKLLVQALEKQKFAVTDRPRRPTPTPAAGARDEIEVKVAGGERGPEAARRSRHVPAAVRRTVFERDGGRCTYVDERGERCRETHGLELHHRHPFGKLGPHTITNLALHCAAHNALAAERDFGTEHMARQREPLRHESLAAERRAAERLMDSREGNETEVLLEARAQATERMTASAVSRTRGLGCPQQAWRFPEAYGLILRG
jgi:hypothetical protein